MKQDKVGSTVKRLSLPVPPYSFSWFDWFCLRYPPGWLILFNRHWQYYHPDPEGWNGLEYSLFLIPGGFYLALLIRWLRLGCRAPRQNLNSVDISYQEAFRKEVLLPIVKHHFRAELRQSENLPETGPLVIAMNHAGMCFPWDFISLGVLFGVRGWVAQPIAHEVFFNHPWLRWWLPGGWSQVLGGIRANRKSFELAVEQASGKTVLLYAPESWRGLAKGWRQRYQLETFDPSFMQLSDRHHTSILPVACLGNESLHPWAFNLNRVAQWLKLPLFPVSILLIAFILFPSMGVWAMPTRLCYFIQPLESPWKESNGDIRLQRKAVYEKAQVVRSRLQTAIDKQLGIL